MEIGNQERSRIDGLLTKLHNKRRVIYEDKLAGIIDTSLYQSIDQDTLSEIASLESKRTQVTDADTDYREIADLWVELPELLQREWFRGNMNERKKIVALVGSNFFINAGEAFIELHPAFDSIKKTNEILKTRK